jgi:hypothetical protein
MARKAKGLTDLQRQAVQCLEAARRTGTSLSAQVRARGLKLRRVYDAIGPLRRRGLIQPLGHAARLPGRGGALTFARVRAEEPANGGLRMRVTLAGGRSAELEITDVAQLGEILTALDRAA